MSEEKDSSNIICFDAAKNGKKQGKDDGLPDDFQAVNFWDLVNGTAELPSMPEIVPYSVLQERQKAQAREKIAKIKIKLENYRCVFNNAPLGSDLEKRALKSIAEHAGQLPNDDEEKYRHLCVAVDYYEGDDDLVKNLFANLAEIVTAISDEKEKLRAYRVLMRSKFSDADMKEKVGTTILNMADSM